MTDNSESSCSCHPPYWKQNWKLRPWCCYHYQGPWSDLQSVAGLRGRHRHHFRPLCSSGSAWSLRTRLCVLTLFVSMSEARSFRLEVYPQCMPEIPATIPSTLSCYPHSKRIPERRGRYHKHRIWGSLGGSWVVISRVLSPLIWAINMVTLLIPPLLTTHEPPSRGKGFRRLRIPRKRLK